MTETETRKIRNAIREERIKRGWTTRELSIRTGLAEATISRIMNGHQNPSALTRRKFELVFGIKQEELFK